RQGAVGQGEVEDEPVNLARRQAGMDDVLERVEAFGDQAAGPAHAGKGLRPMQLDLPVILLGDEAGFDVVHHGAEDMTIFARRYKIGEEGGVPPRASRRRLAERAKGGCNTKECGAEIEGGPDGLAELAWRRHGGAGAGDG